MGQLEKASKRRSRRSKLQKSILGSLYVAGGVSVALLAPNAMQILKYIDPQFSKRGALRNSSLKRSLQRLKDDGFVETRKSKNGKPYLALTDRGRQAVLLMEEKRLLPEKQRKWDKKWRVLIFDVSEQKRSQRDRLRQTLVNLGFTKLQSSVWVYPYPCEELVDLLKRDFKIVSEVVYIIADQIEHDQWLRRQYGLPSAG